MNIIKFHAGPEIQSMHIPNKLRESLPPGTVISAGGDTDSLEIAAHVNVSRSKGWLPALDDEDKVVLWEPAANEAFLDVAEACGKSHVKALLLQTPHQAASNPFSALTKKALALGFVLEVASLPVAGMTAIVNSASKADWYRTDKARLEALKYLIDSALKLQNRERTEMSLDFIFLGSPEYSTPEIYGDIRGLFSSVGENAQRPIIVDPSAHLGASVARLLSVTKPPKTGLRTKSAAEAMSY